MWLWKRSVHHASQRQAEVENGSGADHGGVVGAACIDCDTPPGYTAGVMRKRSAPTRKPRGARPLPLVVERDELGFYVVECPTLPGCYTQGKTLDEALKNIQEVIALVLEEKTSRDILRDYTPQELSFHTITV